MNILFIGGTGNISTHSSIRCVELGYHLTILTRGNHHTDIKGASFIQGDINDFEIQKKLKSQKWDCVVNWIAFTPSDIERDIELFDSITKQYIFISSASCYDTVATGQKIIESTPLHNPYWQYSQDKIDCEALLITANKMINFPVCIVRPSLTYDTVIPVPFGGWTDYNIINRIKQNKPIIIHDDGAALFTITHAKDFAIGLTGLLGNPKTIGQAFHITSDEAPSWNEIYQHIADIFKQPLNAVYIPTDFICEIAPEKTGSLKGDKSNSTLFDNNKIKAFVPDFNCKIPFSEGISQTIQWFEQDTQRQINNPNSDALIENILERYSNQ
ncbi:NAD-dependent epimerase/dehydratase family protein [Marinicellulosiphila megalodicopiae]|uniref:NAD-dependent epimerase/dehydratase family protein n=1 Tax=Marinicellulosiphila megalodicopiae TaxID=2724896 RepID=UPI003BB00E57